MGRSCAQNIFLNAALDIGLALEFRVGKSHWHKAQITRYRRQKKDYRVRFEHTHSEQWVCVRSLVCEDQYRFVVAARRAYVARRASPEHAHAEVVARIGD